MPAAATQSRQLYRRIVDDFIAPRLAVHGFKRRGKDLFTQRPEPDAYWQVACDFRAVRGRDEGWLSVFVCVGFQSLVDFLAGCEAVAARDRRRPCIMAANIGALRPPFDFLEWRLLPDCDAETVGREASREISSHGGAYFAKYGSLPQALAAWEQGINYNLGASAAFYRAAAYWQAGDPAKALQMVEREVETAIATAEASGRQSDKVHLRWVLMFADWLRTKVAAELPAERRP